MNTKIFIPKEEIEKCIAEHLTYEQMAQKFGCSRRTVMRIATKEYGLHSDARKYQQLQNNVSKQPEVKEKISDSVRLKWSEGYYKDRINGMLGVKGFNNSHFKSGKWQFREKALFYHDKICACCGKTIRENEKFDVHHVDENHNNVALTNLELLHVPCHGKFHYKWSKSPYVSITKCFEFEAAHFIPEHYADCKFCHGHSYKLEITIRHRINPLTGMALDFKKLSEAVKNNIINILDHGFINDWIEFPTAENMLYWIWEKLSIDVKGLQKIRLYETSSSYAEITIDDVLELIQSGKFETDWLDEDKLLKNKEFLDNQSIYSQQCEVEE